MNLLMASLSWLTRQATLMVLLMTWRESTHCNGLTVDPPEDLVISDPGHLGHLEITWSPPASLVNMTECPKLYHLEYFNTYRDSWSVIRTVMRTYSAQFDLTKDVRVRVYTLLSGPCTKGATVKSTSYAEVVQKPPTAGIVGTAVQKFVCVYHDMMYMECNWRISPKMPANSKLNLYFWHKKLEQAAECKEYIITGRVRSGCNFTGVSLPDFTDINFCVNGSSPEGPLKPTFMSLQIQNHVKPEPTEQLHLQTVPDAQLKLSWDRPAGRVPRHCLEWEVEHNQEGPDGKLAAVKIVTKQMGLTFPSVHDNEKNCFKVRSKLHTYCAEKSYWSEWSRPLCHPERKEVAPEPEWDMVPVYVCISIVAVLVLLLCVGLVLQGRRSKQVKKPDSLLTTLFARNSVLTVQDA